MKQKEPNGGDLLRLLVELLAEQEGVKIQIDLKEERESA